MSNDDKPEKPSIDGSPEHEERTRPDKFVRSGAGRYGYSDPLGRNDDGIKTGVIFAGCSEVRPLGSIDFQVQLQAADERIAELEKMLELTPSPRRKQEITNEDHAVDSGEH